MYLLCVILIVLAAVLMCFIVLIQNSKGGGLASGFASSNQIMGVRKTTDFLEKATITLAIVIVVFSIVASFAIPEVVEVESSRIQQNAVENNLVNPNLTPDFSQELEAPVAPVAPVAE